MREEGGRRFREWATAVSIQANSLCHLTIGLSRSDSLALYEKPNLLLLAVWFLLVGLAVVALARLGPVAV